MIQISKKAELFDKAIVDLWQAEQVLFYRADAAIYNCSQCTEKMIKGVLRCYDMSYDYDHDLVKAFQKLLDSNKTTLEKELLVTVQAISRWGNSLRYKNMSNDPNIQDGVKIFKLTKQLIDALSSQENVTSFFKEAQEVNNKLLKKSVEVKIEINI